MLIGIDASRTTLARRTGTEAYSLALTRALLALETGHTWRLYFNQAPEPDAWPAHSAIQQRVIPFPRLWTHARLSLEMLQSPPDVLFVPAHVLPLIHPRCSVVTVHDLGYRHFPDAHTWPARTYLELSTRLNARWATRVLADSVATRDDLVQVYGTPAEKTRVVYPGRNEELRRVENPQQIVEVTRRLGIDRDYILYVGTLQPRKNLSRLIEAYGQLLGQWQSAVGATPPVVAPFRGGTGGAAPTEAPLLVLAGQKGWLSDEIFQTVERLGLSDHVQFPGYVPDDDLPALLSGASLFAFPSLYEGFGFPLLEAMACDVPVVCSNSSSLPEVAGDAALLVDPLDVDALTSAMRTALTDEAARSRLIQAGRQQIKNFSWKRAARQTLYALEEAAGE